MISSAAPRSLCVVEIAKAMEACHANARELLEEADILIEARRNARAYTLVHTACEEFAKFLMLEIAGRRVAQGNPPNWKRFWQRLRSHESKIAQAEVRLLQTMTDTPSSDQHVPQNDVLLAYGLIPRNASLYVEAAPNGRFRKPSDINWSVGIAAMRDTAARLLSVTQDIGSSFDAITSHLQGPNSNRDREGAVTTLQHVIERLRRDGMAKERVLGELEKLLKVRDKT